MCRNIFCGLAMLVFLVPPVDRDVASEVVRQAATVPVVDIADIGPVMSADASETELLADAIQQLKAELAIQSPSDVFDTIAIEASPTKGVAEIERGDEFRIALEDVISSRTANKVDHEMQPLYDDEMSAASQLIPMMPETPREESLVQMLRLTSQALDEHAHLLEATENYTRADRLRNLAEDLRIEARELNHK